MARKNIYNVYWYPIVPFDCEKESTYIFANNAREAMNHPMFEKVQVVEARLVTGREEEEARQYGWCRNKEN